MVKKQPVPSKDLEARTMPLESAYPADYVPRTVRQAMAELNAFREEWRKRHGDPAAIQRVHTWSDPKNLTNGTKAGYLAAKKAGKARS